MTRIDREALTNTHGLIYLFIYFLNLSNVSTRERKKKTTCKIRIPRFLGVNVTVALQSTSSEL